MTGSQKHICESARLHAWVAVALATFACAQMPQDCLKYTFVLAILGNSMPCAVSCEATLLWHAGWWTRSPGSS